MPGITGIDANDWDKRIYGPVVIPQDDGTFRLYYTGYTDDGLNWHPCMATSPDMINWTKPNLGLVSFGGNTNNNILLERVDIGISKVNLTDIIEAEGLIHMVIFDAQDVTDHVYSSSDGINFTHSLQVFSNATHGTHIEAKGMVFEEGKYRCYYSQHWVEGVPQRRSIGYYEWYPMIGGTPRNMGLIETFTSTALELQYYDFLPFRYKGSLWACVPFYNSATQILGPLALYRNDYQGKGPWQRKGTLINLGDVGDFDEKMVTAAKPIIVDGTWTMLYTASDTVHDTWPRDMFLAYATGDI